MARLVEYMLLAAGLICMTALRATSDLLSKNALANTQPDNMMSPSRIMYYRRDWGQSRPTTFLLGIFTVMEDVKRRRIIRETMLGNDLPSHVRERLCSLQDYYKNQTRSETCQIIYTFVVGGNRHAKPEYDDFSGKPMTMDPSHMLKHETDLLYLNIRENMNDGKTPTWFTYASRYLANDRIDYVAKADSDTLISIPELLHHVDHELPERTQAAASTDDVVHDGPKLYGGYLNEFDSCGGGGEACDKLRGKVYMSGQFFWLSYDLVHHISSPVIRNTNFLNTHNEDLDLGMKILSFQGPLKLMVCNGAQFWKHPMKDDTEWLREFDDNFKNTWKVAHQHWWNGLYDDSQRQIKAPVTPQFVPDVVID